jgi:malate dehydrogenase
MHIAERQLADVVLVDVVEGVPAGKSLDVQQCCPVVGADVSVTGSNDYAASAGSDIVVFTAGMARRPGMSRDDLLTANFDVVRATVEQAVKYSPNAILIGVTNPLDAMCHVISEVSGFPKERVIGMAGVLDSARFRSFIAAELNVSVEDVTAFVMGGHGDTMVPLVRYSSVAGIPLTDLMDGATIERLVRRTREGGTEILAYLKTATAVYAPSAGVSLMVESILKDKKRILPCSTLLQGQYGIRGLFVGVPVKLGTTGVEQVFEVRLDDSETAALLRSAATVREMLEVLQPKLAEVRAAGKQSPSA